MRIHFLNIKKVENKLKEHGLTEREKFQYILAITLLFQTLTIIVAANGIKNLWEFFANLAALFMIGLGTYYVFEKNGAGRGHDFLERFISLSWVCGVRISLFLIIPAIFIWGIITVIYFPETAQEMRTGARMGTWFDPVFVVLVSGFYYWRIGNYIDRIRGKKH